jgi:FkbM family methyltransferase
MSIRRVAHAPGLRRLAETPAADRTVAAFARGSAVRERLRFAARELAGSRRLATYRIRSSGARVCIRHSTPDVYGLDQVFLQHQFDFPEPVTAALEPHAGDLRAVDLGANIGLFGVHLLGLYPSPTVLAFEPDPANARVLACCVTANGRAGSWRLVQACAAAAAGRVGFVAGEYGVSHVTATGETATIEVEALDVFPHLAEAHLVKIDIEGAEWSLLADPRFVEVPAAAVHLEYHARSCPGADPRARATSALEQAGYSWLPVRHDADGNGIVWAWRS